MEFLKKVGGDKKTADAFKEVFRSALVKAGKDAGFKFTREELDAALTEMKAEIQEDELKELQQEELARLLWAFASLKYLHHHLADQMVIVAHLYKNSFGCIK